ncbi:hypothetical protein STCU_11620 [Strigomonas culicis]|uniref:Uncharacterized protein n=1 Tax=Strigomonas culicis TaxID=28005 RepID=S9TI28_9TRYP|nr:hypothetical protein STCU_11620 [Strigomonas culicis]|eukprot:EPY15998.1 hypothetical protein STCU_11620 [Strigomonas culicis]
MSTTDRLQKDYLYRSLYIRREYQLLYHYYRHKGKAVERAAGADASAHPPSPFSFRNVFLFPPSSMRGVDTERTHSDEHDDGADAEAWPGYIYIAAEEDSCNDNAHHHPSSPWATALFCFMVYIPKRYPFERPRIKLQTQGWQATTAMDPVTNYNLPSHPFLIERQNKTTNTAEYEIPFSLFYQKVEPLKTSVMLTLLNHIYMFFHPSLWSDTMNYPGDTASWLHTMRLHLEDPKKTPQASGRNKNKNNNNNKDTIPEIDTALASLDVEWRSTLQEVLLGKPFIDYLHTNVADFFVAEAEHDDETPEAKGRHQVHTFQEWYCCSFLPCTLHLY